jgi:hypothetical protein
MNIMTYYNEIEILGLLQEECAEVIQIASKIRRFGEESYHPNDPLKLTNITLLENEIGDVRCMVNLLKSRKYISDSNIDNSSRRKHEKLIDNGIIPKPPSFKEFFLKPLDPEVAEAWALIDEYCAKDRKRSDILSEISCATEVAPEEGSYERRNLIMQAARILLEIENLPDEGLDDEN